VENNLFTALTGQSTYENLIKKSGLRRILFDKSCLRRTLFREKIWPAAHSFHEKSTSQFSGIHFISSFLFCLPIY